MGNSWKLQSYPTGPKPWEVLKIDEMCIVWKLSWSLWGFAETPTQPKCADRLVRFFEIVLDKSFMIMLIHIFYDYVNVNMISSIGSQRSASEFQVLWRLHRPLRSKTACAVSFQSRGLHKRCDWTQKYRKLEVLYHQRFHIHWGYVFNVDSKVLLLEGPLNLNRMGPGSRENEENHNTCSGNVNTLMFQIIPNLWKWDYHLKWWNHMEPPFPPIGAYPSYHPGLAP